MVTLRQQQCERAHDYFQQALEIHTHLGLKAEIIADLSYLGQVNLCLDKPEEALASSEQAIALLAEQKEVGEVQQIYLNHYHVLRAVETADATEAEAFLQKAYAAMMDQADRIADEQERQIFLENVRVNQEIHTLWQEVEGEQ